MSRPSITRYRRSRKPYLAILLASLCIAVSIPVRAGMSCISHKPASNRDLAAAIAKKQGLPPGLVKAVISVESSWRPHARSSRDAHGLMQIHAPTWTNWTRAELRDPEINIWAGTEILKNYIRKGHSLREALRLYSGGARNYYERVMKEMSG